MTAEERHIVYDETAVYYTVAGNGSPLLFLHGFGEDHTIWDRQVEFLQQNFRLIIPDIPGSGRSAMLRNKNAGMMEYADCIRAIVDAENINRFVMIGHSMGGYITLAFAEKYPEKLTAFGLFHSSAFADDADKIETRKKAISFIQKNGAKAFLDTSLPGLFFDAEKSKSDIEILLKKGNNFTPAALIQYYEAMIARPDRTAILKKTTLPVLLIMGEHDKAVPFNLSLQQAPMPAHTYVYILRNSAHMGMLEETGKSNNILADFLQFGDFK